jgi:hypothetical protein
VGLLEYVDQRFDEAFPYRERWLLHDYLASPAHALWLLFDGVLFESFVCDDESVRAFLADNQASEVGGLWKLFFDGVEFYEAGTMRHLHRFEGLRDLDEVTFGACVFSSESFLTLLEGGPLWDRVSTLDLNANFSGGSMGEELTMEEELELSRAFFGSALVGQLEHLKISGPLLWNDTARFMAGSTKLAALEALTLGSPYGGLRLPPRHIVRVLKNPALEGLGVLEVQPNAFEPVFVEAFKDPAFLPCLTSLRVVTATNCPDPHGPGMRSLEASRGPGFVEVRWVDVT